MRFRTRTAAASGAIVAVATAAVLGFAGPAAAVDRGAPTGGYLHGFDVSNYQSGRVDFGAEKDDDARFAFIKSGDVLSLNSTPYVKNDAFASQWADAGAAGLVRGVYVVAGPGDGHRESDPVASADLFLDHVGSELTGPGVLPPVLDLEAGATTQCWMSDDFSWAGDLLANQQRMVTWIGAFSDEIAARVGRLPMIYTNARWWDFCTGGSDAFTANKLFLASWTGQAAPTLPQGWTDYAFWQWRERAQTASGFAGDQDVFHGDTAALRALAATPLQGATAPVVTGTATAGETLSVDPAAWGTPHVSYRYQWYRDDGTPIAGATGRRYTAAPADVGERLTVSVTGTRSGYASATMTSERTAPIAAAPLVKQAPSPAAGRSPSPRLTSLPFQTAR